MGDISDMTGYDDYSGVAPNTGFDPMPPGWYSVQIDGAEVKGTKAGGAMLEVAMTVVGPTHAGRKVWDRINIKNANPKAEEFAARQLASLQLACGLVRLADSTMLLGKIIDAKMKVSKEPNQNGDYQNEVSGYRSADGKAATPAPVAAPAYKPPAAAAPVAAAPASKPALPWQR
jgi:hypothetical protein